MPYKHKGDTLLIRNSECVIVRITAKFNEHLTGGRGRPPLQVCAYAPFGCRGRRPRRPENTNKRCKIMRKTKYETKYDREVI